MAASRALNDWDTLGLPAAPQRVVSLVPSVTESLFELGAGERVAGITDYCIHPAEKLAGLPRIGGPKNPDLDLIQSLLPDLVIADRDENRREDVEQLEAAGLKVWVTFPCTVREAIDLLWSLIQVFEIPQRGPSLSALETSFEFATLAAANMTPVRVFCPIWREPASGPARWWMTISHSTYTHDLLRLCGGENIFGGRERRYPLAADLGEAEAEPPGERDTRFPRVTSQEVAELHPDVILLPSEPFPFSVPDLSAFDANPDIPAVRDRRIRLVDGSLLTWPGTRLAKALAELPSILQG